VLGGHLLPLLDIILNVPEGLFEVVEAVEGASDLLLLALEFQHGSVLQPKQLRIAHGVLGVRHFAELGLLLGELLLDALFAQGLLLEHHDRLREVHLAKVHLDGICEKGHASHAAALLRTTTLGLRRLIGGSRSQISVLRGSFFSLVHQLLLVALNCRSPLGPEGWEVRRVHFLESGLSTSRHRH